MIKKWAEDLNGYFFKDDMQVTNTDIKSCSASLIFREMQTKTKASYHLTTVGGMAVSKRQEVFVRMWRKENPPVLLIGI